MAIGNNCLQDTERISIFNVLIMLLLLASVFEFPFKNQVTNCNQSTKHHHSLWCHPLTWNVQPLANDCCYDVNAFMLKWTTKCVTGRREAGDSSSLQTHWVQARLTRTHTLVPPLMWSLGEVNVSHTCSAIYSKCSKWVSQPLTGQLAPCCQWGRLSGIHNKKTYSY